MSNEDWVSKIPKLHTADPFSPGGSLDHFVTFETCVTAEDVVITLTNAAGDVVMTLTNPDTEVDSDWPNEDGAIEACWHSGRMMAQRDHRREAFEWRAKRYRIGHGG